jgi:hypothetical protein
MVSFHPNQSDNDDIVDEKQQHTDHVEDTSNVTTIDGIRVLGLTPDDATFLGNFSQDQRKAVLRKVNGNTLRLKIIE